MFRLSPSNLSSLLGLSCLFAMENSLFLSGRAELAVSTPNWSLLLSNLLGVVAGMILFGRFPDQESRRTAFIKKGAYVFSGCTGALCFLTDLFLPSISNPLFWIASFACGFPLASLLLHFFAVIPRHQQGLFLGLSLALGTILTLFTLLPSKELHPPVVPVFFAILCIAINLSALFSVRTPQNGSSNQDTAEGKTTETDSFVDSTEYAAETRQNPALEPFPAFPRPKKALIHLSMLIGLFFILTGTMDVLFFQYDGAGSVPPHVALYGWLSYIIIGLYIDRRGANLGFFVACFALCVLVPIITVSSENDLAYFVLFSCNIMGKAGVLFQLQIVFARLAAKTRRPGPTICLPYLFMYGGYLLALGFFEQFHPGTAPIMLVLSFLCATFNYFLGSAQSLITILGVHSSKVRTIPQVHTNENQTLLSPEEQRKQRLNAFQEKTGLSPRECDVLEQLVQGLAPDEIAKELSVSTATVKTHISQILRKTGLPNRVNVIVHFYTEPQKTAELPPAAQPAPLQEAMAETESARNRHFAEQSQHTDIFDTKRR